MTIKKITHSYVECDIDGCTAWFFSNTGTGVVDMKNSAKKAGWKTFKDAVRSYHECPECAAKASVWINSKKVGA